MAEMRRISLIGPYAKIGWCAICNEMSAYKLVYDEPYLPGMNSLYVGRQSGYICADCFERMVHDALHEGEKIHEDHSNTSEHTRCGESQGGETHE